MALKPYLSEIGDTDSDNVAIGHGPLVASSVLGLIIDCTLGGGNGSL